MTGRPAPGATVTLTETLGRCRAWAAGAWAVANAEHHGTVSGHRGRPHVEPQPGPDAVLERLQPCGPAVTVRLA